MRDIYLKAGDLYFGIPDRGVRTLLGSCVALTLWQPNLHIVGMCHFVLPARPVQGKPDARYGEDAFALFQQAIERRGLRAGWFVAGLYGGGNMFPEFSTPNGQPIGEQNVIAARRLALRYGFLISDEQVGGYSYRQITLDPADGRVTVHATKVGKP